jgi:molybdopterin-guanine dinucleotide biosynthesis protein MobB
VRIYGVTGWKNAGKTTLMERLVAEIAGRGLSVSSVKHAHHDTDVDQPGRDSHRHRVAGARQVLLASPRRWALMTELRDAPEPPLADLLARLDPVDLVLVEGYKAAPHHKVEAFRSVNAKPPLATRNATIRALAADTPPPDTALPVLPVDDAGAVADFILREVGL